jgi:hypothetical protein
MVASEAVHPAGAGDGRLCGGNAERFDGPQIEGVAAGGVASGRGDGADDLGAPALVP